MVTEEEARKLWCPLREIAEKGGFALCRGSECMMWRYNINQDSSAWKNAGYCGLAGDPHCHKRQ